MTCNNNNDDWDLDDQAVLTDQGHDTDVDDWDLDDQAVLTDQGHDTDVDDSTVSQEQ